ncbi:malonyl-CoA O-methyltransferase [Povalibacter uvarum]|uniref:Malonyl-[acyl-carrier protein] O-methyltransferase n=1 Tax=Povalibacter uvarum TaxID=732238 RepID=A0A841HIT6_9GAMM|nr:malonyl-ACP O-methyltransferase BioC [Povalibacter uvarum]MBB6093111.1 malonyl-CoA O-methyltransferase [Povalibacter uvarum]
MPSVDEFFLDPRAVRRAFDAAAKTFDAAAVVHAEIRSRLIERLDVVRLDPSVVLDLGAATGQGSRALKDRYPRARVVAVDLSTAMLREARKKQRLFRRFQRVAADAARLPLARESADLVFSNLMLQWCNDPDAIFRESRRVLRPNGLLTFASLGPDSLRELRGAWAAVDERTHVHRFIDMHDLGDALVRTGFAEPVMDTERLTITYSNVETLFGELRRTGSTNQAQGRPRHLTGRSAGQRLREACDRALVENVLPVTLEIVYGHAWAGQTRRGGASDRGETRVPVTSIGRRGP